jgi:hypothetical protein
VSFDDRVNASAERALTGVLQSRRDELKMRLEESSTEWGFEDPIYLFYHQSCKCTRSRDTPKRSSICSRASRRTEHRIPGSCRSSKK